MKTSRAILIGIFFLSGCGGCNKQESAPPAKPAAPAQEPAKAQPAATVAPQAAAPADTAPANTEPGADDGDCIVIADANPDFGPPPLAVTFSAEAECSSGAPTYKWDFGDGSAGSTEMNPSHTYTKLGDYVATVVVTSPRGSTTSDEIDITVEEDE